MDQREVLALHNWSLHKSRRREEYALKGFIPCKDDDGNDTVMKIMSINIENINFEEGYIDTDDTYRAKKDGKVVTIKSKRRFVLGDIRPGYGAWLEKKKVDLKDVAAKINAATQGDDPDEAA